MEVKGICGHDDFDGIRNALNSARYIDEDAFEGWRIRDGQVGGLCKCDYEVNIVDDAAETERVNGMIDVSQRIDDFMGVYTVDPMSRYRMYDHTHEKFREYQALNDKVSDAARKLISDELPLYLDMYLAGWGMFRNSFLQFKDYRFLEGICKIVCDDGYAWLMDVDLFGEDDPEGGPDPIVLERYIHDILELKDRITYYFEYKKSFYKPDSVEEHIDSVTDTQVTKILLVALGCIPAYDTYVKHALHDLLGNQCQSITGESLGALLNLAWRMRGPVREKMDEYKGKVGTTYSFMKYVDMALWGFGFSPDEEGE